MEPLGFFGIFKVTTRTLLNNLKHFLYLSALVLLPVIALYVAVAPKPDNAQAFSALSSLLSDHFDSTVNNTQMLPFDGNDPGLQRQQLASSHLLSVSSVIYGLFLAFVSLPPLTVSLCRGYLNQHLNVRDSLNGILKSGIGLVLTYVCLFAAFAAVIVVIVISCVVIGVVLAILKVNVVIPLFLVAAVEVAGLIYLTIVWSLASTVTILEEKWGWDAMQRSAYLLKGRKGVAFFLMLFFDVISMFVQIYVSKGASLSERLGMAALDGGLVTFVHLYRFATTVVLYMSSKKYHKESVDDLPGAIQRRDDYESSENVDDNRCSKYVGLSNMDLYGDV